MNLKGIPVNCERDQELQAYNSLVLQSQDEVYNLAYDLLGAECMAAAVVQEVFVSGFDRRKDTRLMFRLRVMRWVVRACLGRSQVLPGPERLEPRLARLTNEEKVALILVERLGLNYPEAAVVAEKSAADIRRILAQARLSLSEALDVRE